MVNEICPKCGRKLLRYRKITNDYICNCGGRFDENKKEYRIKDAEIDEFENYYKIEIIKEKDKIKQIKTYFLEEGKITLRGEYSKLRKDIDCTYPERLSCNYGIGFKRCKYMKYERSMGIWKCINNKEKK